MVRKSKWSTSPAEQLTRADDLMSDLLDSFLWSNDFKSTIKFTQGYRRPRGLDLVHIKHIIAKGQRDGRVKLNSSAIAIRKLPAVQHYMGRGEPPHFDRHIRLYLDLFLPGCGIYFRETDRYANRDVPTAVQLAPFSRLSSASSPASPAPGAQLQDTLEPPLRPSERVHLAVFATRSYAAGDAITSCRGSFADLTDDEDNNLRCDEAGKAADFSHLVNSQGKFQVFCGPARFVNHDCDNNVQLERDGRTIYFKAVKPIRVGEEILTSYGPSYFGEANCECMCATCERLNRGIFATSKIRNQIQDDAAGLVERGRTRSGCTPQSRATGSRSPSGSRPPSANGTPSPRKRKTPMDRSFNAVALRLSAARMSSQRGKRPGLVVPPPLYRDTVDLRELLDLPVEAIAGKKRSQGNGKLDSQVREEAKEAVDEDVGGKEDEDEDEQPPRKRGRKSSDGPYRTYWQTAKQRLSGILPWEDKKAALFSPPVQEPRVPSRSYWVSSKDKAAGRVPWETPSDSTTPEPLIDTTTTTRTTRAAARAAQDATPFRGLPTAPRGGRLTFKVVGSQDLEMLQSSVGRELLGLRPRKGQLKAHLEAMSASPGTVALGAAGTSTPEERGFSVDEASEEAGPSSARASGEQGTRDASEQEPEGGGVTVKREDNSASTLEDVFTTNTRVITSVHKMARWSYIGSAPSPPRSSDRETTDPNNGYRRKSSARTGPARSPHSVEDQSADGAGTSERGTRGEVPFPLVSRHQ